MGIGLSYRNVIYLALLFIFALLVNEFLFILLIIIIPCDWTVSLIIIIKKKEKPKNKLIKIEEIREAKE